MLKARINKLKLKNTAGATSVTPAAVTAIDDIHATAVTNAIAAADATISYDGNLIIISLKKHEIKEGGEEEEHKKI